MIISTGAYKKIFSIEAKKIFCTRCPKSAVRGGKTKFLLFFHRGIRKKYLVRSQIFRYGLPKDFLSKWQKS